MPEYDEEINQELEDWFDISVNANQVETENYMNRILIVLLGLVIGLRDKIIAEVRTAQNSIIDFTAPEDDSSYQTYINQNYDALKEKMAVIKKIEKEINDFRDAMKGSLEEQIEFLSQYQYGLNAESFWLAGLAIDIPGMTAQQIQTILDYKYDPDGSGMDRNDRIDRTSDRLLREISILLIGAALAGRDIDDIVARIEAFFPSENKTGWFFNNLEALERTELQVAGIAALMLYYWQSRSILEGVYYSAVWDNRICDICAGYGADFEGTVFLPSQVPVIIPIHPRCFEMHTNIYTSQGNKKICKIKIGDYVLTHKGRYRKVLDVIKTDGYQDKFVTLHCHYESGSKNYKISSTYNHLFLTDKYGHKEWVSANDLNVGDHLYIRASKCSICGHLIPYNRKCCNRQCAANIHKINYRSDPDKKKQKSARLKEEYRTGKRDGNKTTKACHKKVKLLVKIGEFKAPNAHGYMNQDFYDVDFIRKLSNDRKGKDNPMHKSKHSDEYWQKISQDKKEYYENNPEKHPNSIVNNKWHKTDIEIIMGSALAKEEIVTEYNYSVGSKWVDYAIVDKKIAVECDGEYWHQDKEKEQKRDRYLSSKGWTVLHFSDNKIKNNIDECIDEIKRILKNHNGDYAFCEVVINKIETNIPQKCKTVYNLSVEEDESYTANGFAVHNCRCQWIPAIIPWSQIQGIYSIEQFPKSIGITSSAQMLERLKSLKKEYSTWEKVKYERFGITVREYPNNYFHDWLFKKQKNKYLFEKKWESGFRNEYNELSQIYTVK